MRSWLIRSLFSALLLAVPLPALAQHEDHEHKEEKAPKKASCHQACAEANEGCFDSCEVEDPQTEADEAKEEACMVKCAQKMKPCLAKCGPVKRGGGAKK